MLARTCYSFRLLLRAPEPMQLATMSLFLALSLPFRNGSLLDKFPEITMRKIMLPAAAFIPHHRLNSCPRPNDMHSSKCSIKDIDTTPKELLAKIWHRLSPYLQNEWKIHTKCRSGNITRTVRHYARPWKAILLNMQINAHQLTTPCVNQHHL